MKNNSIIFKIFNYGDNLEKKLLKNHIYAVVILIAMIISSYIVISNIITTQKDGARLINISGKQRMFTQKVLTSYYKSMYLGNSKFIMQTFGQIDKNNKFLIKKLQDKNSLSYDDIFIKELFFKKKGILETYDLYKKKVVLKEGVEKTCKELFSLYDEVTSYYQDKLTRKVETLLLYETVIFIISLLTVILEGTYIFRPAIIGVYEKHNELKNINSNLNEKANEQLNILREQEQILIQKTKMAEMGEMLSDISHQWKQPLTILSMLLETIELELEEEYISKEQIDSDLQEAFKLIKHMHQTIEDFKNFYRPDTSKRTFNIYNAVNDVIKMEKTSLNCHTIELSFNSSYKGTLFHGFESQFKQVLLTIINNAIEQITLNIESQKQAKDSGKIDIDIEKDNKNVKIHISDNAGGIDQNIIAKIFNPYFTTKNDNGGSGIGLYMSKTILEKNFHGSVQVLNVADGASFIITIPL